LVVYGSDRLGVIEAIDLFALDVFNAGRRQITLGDVDHHLGQLRNHCAKCTCGRCAAAPIMRADRVLMIVRVWQASARRHTAPRTALIRSP
jgi:hypothetical protein